MKDDAGQKRKLDATFVGGLGWTVGAKWATQAVTWASVIALARILNPAEFGIMDMAGFCLGLTTILAEFGVGTAVLQMRELDDRVVGQMKTAAVLLGAAAFGLSVVIAPLVAAFFHAPELKLLVIVNSLALFLAAFQSMPLGLLRRDMDYRRLSIAEVTLAVIQAGVAVGCAFAGCGYWSLVAGGMAGRTAYLVLTSYWKPIPYVVPRWSEVAAPLRFGFQVAVSRLAWAAYAQLDALMVGRALGASALGSYRFAVNFASVPAEKVGTLIMRVTDPLFARVQEDKGLVRRYFLVINEALTLVVFPLALGLAVVAPELVLVVLGPNWSGAVGPMQWLALFMAFRDTGTLSRQALTSQRQTGFLMWTAILNAVVMPISFYFASRWGASAVAAAWIVMAPVTIMPTALRLLRMIDCSLRDYLSVFKPPAVGCAAMVAVMLATEAWFLPTTWPALWRLTAQVAAGGAIYSAVLFGPYHSRVVRYIRFFSELYKDRQASRNVEVTKIESC